MSAFSSNTFCDAVRAKRVVEMRYDRDTSYREFAPHAVFRTKDGDLRVSGVQISNPAKPADSGEWRTFDLELVRDMRITYRGFHRSPNFNPSTFAEHDQEVVCSVNYL